MGWTKGGADEPRQYSYTPKWDHNEDRCPDHRRSDSNCWYFDKGKKVGCVLEVKKDDGTVIGVIILDGESDPKDPLGKLRHGVSVLSIDEIRYD